MASSANNPTHPLVQEVKQKSGLSDDNQAEQYTQQALGVLHENAGKDPQGLGSLIGTFLGQGGTTQTTAGSERQKGGGGESAGEGGLSDIAGKFIGG
jgi:hypothetical protein